MRTLNLIARAAPNARTWLFFFLKDHLCVFELSTGQDVALTHRVMGYR